MGVTVLHREDIKAELRKRHGTVSSFALARGLKPQAVRDWLRGRTSAPVGRVVAAELGVSEVQHSASMNVDDNSTAPPTHRLNAEAR